MMTRDELKSAIISYLISVGVTDKALVAKSLKAVKESAGETCDWSELNAEMKKYAKDAGVSTDDSFYYRVSWHFSPRHYAVISGFVKEFEKILEDEMEASMALERAIEAEVKGYIDPSSPDFYDDLGCPDFAILIYPDRVEVKAYEPGVGDIIPRKNRRYVGCAGDVRWIYPASELPTLQSLGRPVVDVAKL